MALSVNTKKSLVENKRLSLDGISYMEYLRDAVLSESMDYVKRIILVNSRSQDRLPGFFKTLEEEFEKMCLIRKFTILNINVVRENQERVFGNDTLRSFYFELYKAVMYRLELDLGEDEQHTLLTGIAKSSVKAPCAYHQQTATSANSPLFLRNQDFQNLCGQVYVDVDAVGQWQSSNPWYFVVLLVNLFGHNLLENMKEFTGSINPAGQPPRRP